MSFWACNTIKAFKEILPWSHVFFFLVTNHSDSVTNCLVDCPVSVFFFLTMFFQTILTYYPLGSLLAAVRPFYRHDSICPWWHIWLLIQCGSQSFHPHQTCLKVNSALHRNNWKKQKVQDSVSYLETSFKSLADCVQCNRVDARVEWCHINAKIVHDKKDTEKG